MRSDGFVLSVLLVLLAGSNAYDCSSWQTFTSTPCTDGATTFSLDAGLIGSGETVQWSTTSAKASFTGATNTQHATVVHNRGTGITCGDSSIRVTLIVTPTSGAPVTCHQTSAIKDEVPPVLSFSVTPGDKIDADSVEIDDVVTAEVATCDDECDGARDVGFVENVYDTPFGNADPAKFAFAIERKWTATDKCGNTVNHAQSIDVVDTTPPVFAGIPADLTLACSEDLPPCDTITASDNSGNDVQIVSDSSKIDVTCDHGYTLLRTWTTQDEQGNVATASATAVFVDDEPPTLTGVPGSATVQCDAVPNAAAVTVSDNCDTQAKIDYNEAVISRTNTHTFSIERIWTGVDACGNQAEHVQTVMVHDDVAPIVEIDGDETIECNGHTPTACPSAISDNCDNNAELTFSESQVAGSCANEYDLVHTYMLKDESGNVATESRTISVVDTQAPTLKGVPADVTQECDAPAAVTVTAFDACETGTVITAALVETVLETTATGSKIERAWTATDQCGHASVDDQTITLHDTTPPTLKNVPTSTSINVGCNMLPQPALVTADDNCCDNLDVQYEQTIIEGACDTEYTLIRTWTSTDCHGNTASFTQTINVHSVDPVLTNLPIAMLQVAYTNQSQTIPVAEVGVTTWCDEELTVTVDESGKNVGSCANSFDIVRTFSATNGCGTASYTQSIHIYDYVSPIISTPLNRASTCDYDQTAWGVTSTDSDGASVAVVENCTNTGQGGNPADECYGKRTCEFTATDPCGNTVSSSAYDIWEDVEAPVLDGNCTIEEVTTATDACQGSIAVSKTTETEAGACPIMYITVDTYTATDTCGLSSTCVRRTGTYDTEKPIISGTPANATYECLADVPALGDLSASDNFDESVTTATGTEYPIPNGCSSQIVRTWTVCDCANNCAETQQHITVEEVTLPTIGFTGTGSLTGSDDATEECPFTIPVATMTVNTHCGASYNVSATTGSSTPSGLPYPVTQLHHWTWTDGCLSHEETQTVTVQDTTAPVVSVSDSDNACTYLNTSATSTDACTTSSCQVTATTYTGSQVSSCEEYVQTWVCTDEVGNAATAVDQTIRAVDQEGPTITTNLVPEITLECPETYTIPTVQASDNCGNFQVPAPAVDSSPVVEGKTGTDIYTWTAVDDCGLTSTISQTVHTIDTTAPVFDVPLAPTLEVDCAPSGFVTQTTTDACHGVVEVVETEVEAHVCTNAGVHTYIYTATDASGQVAQVSQTVTFVDITAPTSPNTQLPNLTIGDETTIESTNPLAGLQAEATDNCGGDVTVQCAAETDVIPCKTRAMWSCTLSDACGNTNTLANYLTVTQVHSYNVTLSSKPASVSLDCSEPMPDVVDVTTVDGTVVASPTVTLSGSNAACSTYLRSWAVSFCDHEDSHEQTITFTDTMAPAITPDTFTPYQCITDVPSISNSTATVIDDCDENAGMSITESTTNIAEPQSVQIMRTYTAADVCGMNSVMHRTITVQDTIAPTMTNLPEDVTIACLDPFPTTAPAAQDNCGSVTVEYTTSSSTNGCPCDFTALRTWVATDEYANTFSHVQTVTSHDSVPPVLGPTPTETVSVEWADWNNASNTYSTQQTLFGTDDVDGSLTVTTSENRVDGTSPHHFTVYRSWNTADECGNTAAKTQTMIVSDNVPPEPCIPTHQQVECDDLASIVSAETVGQTCTATFSEDVTFSYSARTEPGSCDNDYKIINDFTITDQGGNSATFEQTVTVVDSQPPYFDDHASNKTTSITASQCGAEGPIPVTAQDACSTPTVTSETVESPAGTFRTTYTATDSCGHTETTVVTEYLVDITPPVIVLDAVAVVGTSDTVNVDCEEGTLPVYGCEEVCDLTCDISLTSNTIDTTCTHSGVRVQEWTASDVAGNTATFTHTVIFSDATAPVITTGDDRICQCGEVDCFPSAIVEDSCDSSVFVTLVDDGHPNGLFTYTSTDTCGNMGIAVQNITGSNDTPPTFTGGADYTVECEDMLQNRPIPSIENDCGPLTTESVDVSHDNAGCSADNVLRTIVRTWTTTDLAGHVATQDQTVTITDSQDPVLAGYPEDNQHYECSEPTYAVTASDSCDGPLTVGMTRVDTHGTYSLTTEMTWTATDSCGKVATVTRTFDVEDTTPPVASPASLSPLSVTCRNLNTPPNVTFMDNCGGEVTVTMTTEDWSGTCLNDGVYVRTFTGVDASAQQTVLTQTITSVAAVNPTCSVTSDQSITCEEDYFESDDMVVCTDECGNSLETHREDVLTPTCGTSSAESGQVTWTTTDSCGLYQSVFQNREKLDQINPFFSSFPTDTNVECAPETPEAAVPDDTCSSVTVNNQTTTATGSCEHQGHVITVFTATDSCGNSYAQSQTSTYDDSTSPVLAGQPDDVTIDCSDTQPVATVTATDNCAVVNVQMVPDTQTGTGNVKTVLTRTFSTADSCGNSASHTQTITAIDTTPPTLHGNFTDLTFQCVAAPPSSVSATDDCGEATVTVDEEVTDNCGGTSVTIYTYTATDAVGLTSQETRTVNVVDTQVPEMTFVGTAVDTTIECGDERPTSSCSASDDCDSGVTCVLTETEETTPSTTLVIRSWSAVDSCGNDVTEVYTITILDTTNPVIVAPGDATKDCATVVVPAVGTVSDICDVNITLNTATSSSAPCEGSMVYIYDYTATDTSGLTASDSTTITYTDDTAPSFSVSSTDATYQCGDTPAPPDFDAPPTDNCGSVTIIKNNTSPTDITCPTTSIVEYTLNAQDSCGNLGTPAVVTYSFEDTTPPVVASSAVDVTANAGDQVPLPTVTFTDVCSSVTESFSQISTGDHCALTTVRTWSATDECGNAASTTQTVTYLETALPTLVEVPADITIECGDDYSLGTPYATDRAGRFLDVNTTKTTNLLDDCNCKGNYIYTWSVTDSCDQVATAATTVTIQDTTIPSITCHPEDMTVGCDVVPANEPHYALDVSFSGPVTVNMHQTEVPGDCDMSYKIVRDYQVEDCSNNVYSHSQTITVVDDSAPIFTRAVSDKTVECSCDAVADVRTPELAVSDNCDSTVTSVFTENKVPTTGNNYLQIHSWVATDSCGNSASRLQTITVQDTVAPVISHSPEDETVPCQYADYAPAPNNIAATDACEGDIAVDYNEDLLPGACNFDYDLVRTWTASDANGNVATKLQTVSVTDTEAPQKVGPNSTCLSPPDGSVREFALVDIFPVYDNCDTVDISVISCNSTQVSFEEANLAFPSSCSFADDVLSVEASRAGGMNSGNPREYVLYAEISDSCGNAVVRSHTFLVPAPEDAVNCH